MIIKNLNADYSSCGIGKLITLSADTQTIISAYGKVLNLNQKGAIQTFFDSIAPFKSKFDILLLPILASTVQNGLYNAAKLLLPSATVLTDLSLGTKGISVTPYSSTVTGTTSGNGTQNYLISNPVGKNNNCHLLAFINNDGRYLGNSAFGGGNGISISASIISSANTVFPSTAVTGTSGTGYGLNYVSFQCTSGVASIQIAKLGGILGTFAPVITTKADLSNTYSAIRPFSSGTQYLNWLQNSCSVFSTGSALTSSELTIYEAAIASLVAVF